MSKRFANETTDNSRTALLLAAQRGHIKVVEKLLELKADFTISDDSNRTVLHYAITYPDILTLLLKVNYLELRTGTLEANSCVAREWVGSSGDKIYPRR